MKKLILLFLFTTTTAIAQVGIGTTSPRGALDVTSENQGVVVPRVSCIENVTDGQGNPAVDGTIVYDNSRQKTCYRVAGNWICLGTDGSGNATVGVESEANQSLLQYLKASNTESEDRFGESVDISDDGAILAVGAFYEDSSATGINGDSTNNDESASGCVFIFQRSGSLWIQQAYLKASNTESFDQFGISVDLNQDGTFLAVGALFERSASPGVNGDESDNSAGGAGAVYIFSRSGSNWSQQAYLKSADPEITDFFGRSVSIDATGTRVAVGVHQEDSNANGINGDPTNNSLSLSGAVYVFIRAGTTWSQEAYIKASNPGSADYFGIAISISDNGEYLAVGSYQEDSNAVGINGDQSNDLAEVSGAVYIFQRSGTTWSQQAYVKASNTESFDRFGFALSLNFDGSILAVGAAGERSNATGINGNQSDNSANASGAVYIFNRTATTWTQTAYIKSSNSETGDWFGRVLRLSKDGETLLVTAIAEDHDGVGVCEPSNTNNNSDRSGAVYVFKSVSGNWSQSAYIKALDNDPLDEFGNALSMSFDGSYLFIGSSLEDGNGIGTNGDPSDNSAINAGAVYIYD